MRIGFYIYHDLWNVSKEYNFKIGKVEQRSVLRFFWSKLSPSNITDEWQFSNPPFKRLFDSCTRIIINIAQYERIIIIIIKASNCSFLLASEYSTSSNW
jgi:hypothetical protein